MTVNWKAAGYRAALEPFDENKYEYTVTKCSRKGCVQEPMGKNWVNIDFNRGEDDYDEYLWRRLKMVQDKISPAQCRAARAVLIFELPSLSNISNVPVSAIVAFEADKSVDLAYILALKRCFESWGIEFIDKGIVFHFEFNVDIREAITVPKVLFDVAFKATDKFAARGTTIYEKWLNVKRICGFSDYEPKDN